MQIIKYLEHPIRENPHKIDVPEIYNKKSAHEMLISLKPGEFLKPHKTSADVFSFVVEGIRTIYIGGESQVCEAYSLIESPADMVHYTSNTTECLARILVVKVPGPTKLSNVL